MYPCHTAFKYLKGFEFVIQHVLKKDCLILKVNNLGKK